MVLVDGQGVPLGVHLSSASTAEVSLAETTLAQVAVPTGRRGRPRMKPQRIVADRGYVSRPLWERLRRRGIDLIVPPRRSQHTHYVDGRKLRRYRRRWKIERTNAWLLNFRRLTVRYEHQLERYRAFVYLACALITLRQF
jgi:transposase